jgi:hypothetical protein
MSEKQQTYLESSEFTVSDELYFEFEDAYSPLATRTYVWLTEELRSVLSEINESLSGKMSDDEELWALCALDRPEWAYIRELAAYARNIIGG